MGGTQVSRPASAKNPVSESLGYLFTIDSSRCNRKSQVDNLVSCWMRKGAIFGQKEKRTDHPSALVPFKKRMAPVYLVGIDACLVCDEAS